LFFSSHISLCSPNVQVVIDAADIQPTVTWGTSPQGTSVILPISPVPS